MKRLTSAAVLSLLFLSASCSDISSQWVDQVSSSADANAAVASSDTNALSHLLGDQFVSADKKAISFGGQQSRIVGIYFSAHWCGPCRAFSPMLVKVYNDLKKEGMPFNVVLVSFDRTEEEMFAYMKDAAMPWPALPFGSPRKDELVRKFGVRAIPTLVVLDAGGKVVSKDGREDIMRLGAKAFEKWK